MSENTIPYHQFPAQLKPSETFRIVPKERYIVAHRNQQIHRHHFYELLFVWEGAGKQFIDFINYPIRNNSAVFIKPNQVHQSNIQQFGSVDVLIFNHEFYETNVDTLFSDSYLFPLPNLYLDLSESEIYLFKRYLDLLKTEYFSEADASILRNLLSIMLKYLDRLYKTNQNAQDRRIDPRTIRFQKLLETNFAKEHLPRFYASELSITVKHLNTIVQKDLGKSASTLIRERVLLEIKRLLSYSELRQKEIAYALGFEDPSYMSHYFKKYTGISPRQFKA